MNEKMKRLLAIVLSALMLVGMATACGNGSSSDPGTPAPAPSPTAGNQEGASSPPPEMIQVAPVEPDSVFADHLDIVMTNDTVAVLNPTSPGANTTPVNWVFTMIYDRLIERDHDTGEYMASLATSWESTDFQTYTLTLRDDVYFHNGDKFTADDVVNTVHLAKEVGAGSPAGVQWAPVDTVKAIDPTTVEFVLGSVFVDFYFNLSMPSAGILNIRAVEANSEEGTWVGTGPYVITEFVSNNFTRFARNENYWNDEKNIITPSIVLRFVPEVSARTIRMQNGESQLSFGVHSDDLYLFQEDPDNFEVVGLTFNFNNGVSFNMNDPITSDHNFRMAVAHAMEKNEIALFSAGEWARGAYDSGTIWGYQTEFRNDGIPAVPHDLDEAKRYLELSSYNGEEIEIAASIITNIRAAQVLQEQLRLAGINTVVTEYDVPGMFAYMLNPNSGSQMGFFYIQMTYSSSSYRNLVGPGGAQNLMHYENPIVTQMLDEAAAMTDTAQREAHFLRIQELVAEDMPFINAFWRILGVVAARGIGGITLPSDVAQLDLREIYMVIS